LAVEDSPKYLSRFFLDSGRAECGISDTIGLVFSGQRHSTVFTEPLEITDKKGLKPLMAANFQIFRPTLQAVAFDPVKARVEHRIPPSVLYGCGRGFQLFQSFSGVLLKEVLMTL
jgi:hypothetical protein